MISNTSNDDHIGNGVDYILLFRLIVWGYAGMILSIFGIVGNIITILVLISSSMRKTSTNVYLTALSCSNILFLLIFIPSYSIRYLLGYSVYMSNQPPFAFEILLTRLPTTPVYNTILLSIIYLTIAVSMDRLILIKFPLKAKRILTKRTTLITIFLIYMFSILYCIPYWLEQHYIPELKQCRLTKIGKKIHKYARIYAYIPIVYVIPFVTLACINITIILNLLAKKRHRESLIGKVTKKKATDNHITLMLVTVVIVFVLSQFPLLVLNAWYAIDPLAPKKSLEFETLNSLGVLLIVLNTSTNFLLYCFFGQKFRRTLIDFILNIFPNYLRKPNVQTQSLKQNRLSLPTQQQRASRTSSTTTYDSKLIKTKSNEQVKQILVESSSPLNQIPIRTSNEESRPLLSSIIIHNQNSNKQILPIEEKSQIDSNKHLSIDEKQILILKI
jgi:neuropeptide Y receptor type 1